MQFEIGISTMRYLPARGTAGFARSLVSGNNRVPAPPPSTTERTRLVLGDICAMPCVPATDDLLRARRLPLRANPVQPTPEGAVGRNRCRSSTPGFFNRGIVGDMPPLPNADLVTVFAST